MSGNNLSPIDEYPNPFMQHRHRLQTVIAQLSLAPLTDESLRIGGMNSFAQLGDELFWALNKQLTTENRHLASTGVRHGFMVVARILQYAPEAYRTYCQEKGLTPTLEQLVQILHNSARTPEFFARMSGDVNASYEIAFDINDEGLVDPNEPFPFIVSDHPALQYVPNPEILRQLEKDPYIAAPLQASEPYTHCPARGKFLSSVWQAAIDHCARSPQLFAAQLSLEITKAEVDR